MERNTARLVGAQHDWLQQPQSTIVATSEPLQVTVAQNKEETCMSCGQRLNRSSMIIYPSTAGERSGLLLPLNRYLLWLCRRGGRPGPKCSLAPKRPPICPPRPAGTDPPIGPPPSPPKSPKLPKRLPGSRGSESGVSLSVVNGLSNNRRCHSCRDARSDN